MICLYIEQPTIWLMSYIPPVQRGSQKVWLSVTGNLMDYYEGLAEQLPLASMQSFALLSALSTDLGNTVLFGALLSAATLHLFTKEESMDAVFIHHYMAQQPIDCIKICWPSHWQALSIEEKILLPEQVLIFGGDILSTSIVEQIRASEKAISVVNHYGPTETTIGKLLHLVDLNCDYSTIPIGQTFSDSQSYVLTKAGEICPFGEKGELLIGGQGLAKGYLNRPLLTAERFVKKPFDPNAPGYLYKTGDLVRRKMNGDIEFLGRIDDQVKIAGFRIELAELEAISLEYAQVQFAKAIVKADQTGGKQIILYLHSAEAIDQDTLKELLRQHLPDYMIPAQIIALEEIPLTSNGKLNKKLLPDPLQLEQETRDAVAPRN